MEFGISLALVKPLPVEESLAKIAAAGFKCVELTGGQGPIGLWWQNPNGFRKALDAAGLTARTAHSPGVNNGTPDEAARRASIDETSAIFQPAAEVGVEVIVVHPNTPDGEDYTEAGFEASLARSVESLTMLADRAKDAGVRLAVENLPMRHLPRPGGRIEDTLRMIDSLGNHVGICFDVGHSNANVDDPVAEIRTAGERIFCVHLQDNDGIGEDQHLIPGEGTVRWPEVVEALATHAPNAYPNFEIGLKDHRTGETRDIEAVLASLACIRTAWGVG